MYNGDIFPVIENNTLRGIVNFFETGEYIIFVHRTFALFILLIVIYVNYDFFRKKSDIKKNYLLIMFNFTFISQILL